MEQWKAIPGYEGLYEASNLGRIKSLANRLHAEPIILKQRYKVRDNRKDFIINLNNHGLKKTFLVARVIAKTWLNDFSDDLTVNHIDGDTLNNCVSNLECITNEENIRHGHMKGLYRKREHPCVLTNSKGESKCFETITAACYSIGRPNYYISKCLYAGCQITSIDGEHYDFTRRHKTTGWQT